jgi:hypothetical protein
VIEVSTAHVRDGARYEIVLGRRLGARSARSFEGFELVEIPGDGMLIRGHVADQAALHGVLALVRDLGIPLLAVRMVEPDRAATKSAAPTIAAGPSEPKVP